MSTTVKHTKYQVVEGGTDEALVSTVMISVPPSECVTSMRFTPYIAFGSRMRRYVGLLM